MGLKIPFVIPPVPQIGFLEPVFHSRIFLGTILGGVCLLSLTLAGFAVFGNQPKQDFSKITLSYKLPVPSSPTAPTPTPSTATQNVAAPLAPPPQTVEKQVVEDAVAGLHESTAQGLVPIIRTSDGLTPFKAYSAPFSPPAETKAMLAIVVTDFGLSRRMTGAALNLPAGVTLALSPYTDDPQSLTTSAREDSHEVWLSLPLQTTDNADWGPLTLRVGNSLEENRTRFLKTLARATGYAGVIMSGSLSMTPQDVSFSDILRSLNARGLGLAAFIPQPQSLEQAASNRKIPIAVRDFAFISTPTEVTAHIQKAIGDAEANRKAVLQLPLTPVTAQAIKDSLSVLEQKNIALAPLSAYINQK